MSVLFDRSRSICVVGFGAATSIGTTAQSTVAAACAGIAGFSDHPSMIDRSGEPMIVAIAPYIDVNAVGEDRFVALAGPALREALQPAAGVLRDCTSVPAIVGLPERRPGVPESLPASLDVTFSEAAVQGVHISHSSTLSKGHSAGLMAMGLACETIRSGRSEFCLAGGVDSYMDPDTLDWLEKCDQLHKSDNAFGFIPGEAAGFCLLSSEEAAARHQLDVLGRLLCVEQAREEMPIKTSTVCIGIGLTEAVHGVLRSLPSVDSRIHQTICDQNGEAYRGDEFGFMMARSTERFEDSSNFRAPADCWGDVGAASGPLFALLGAFEAAKGLYEASLTLLMTSSEAGDRAAGLLLTEPRRWGGA